MRAEVEVVRLPSRRVESGQHFDTLFEDEHARLYKALYFVTGNRQEAEELMQDAFLKVWERWDHVRTMEDPVGYLFKVALNGFRMQRRRTAMAVRKTLSLEEHRDEYRDADIRADIRRLLVGLTPRQRAAVLLIDLLGYPSDQAAAVLGVRASTARSLATQGRQALRATEGDWDA